MVLRALDLGYPGPQSINSGPRLGNPGPRLVNPGPELKVENRKINHCMKVWGPYFFRGPSL